jgi:hypothetical protein
MAITLTPTPKPWAKYAKSSSGPGQGQLQWKLLIPGWGGRLEPEELAFIVDHLVKDSDLRRWWGMKPSWKRIPEDAVQRLALEGSEEDQALNRRLARPRQQPRKVA